MIGGGGVDSGDGSVMMIGGGGKYCNRADHGIGITETDAASFVEMGGSATKYDFGLYGYLVNGTWGQGCSLVVSNHSLDRAERLKQRTVCWRIVL